MMEQTTFLAGPAMPNHDEQRARSVDLTPTPVVHQGLLHLRARRILRAPKPWIWDPCAGSGVFGMAAASVWPGSIESETSRSVGRSAEYPN